LQQRGSSDGEALQQKSRCKHMQETSKRRDERRGEGRCSTGALRVHCSRSRLRLPVPFPSLFAFLLLLRLRLGLRLRLRHRVVLRVQAAAIAHKRTATFKQFTHLMM
jgi:hypothetical protein